MNETTPRSFDFTEYFGSAYLETLDVFKPSAASDADARRFVRLGRLRKGDTVLDVGCGEGRLSRRLAKAGMVVRGIDTSDLLLRRANALSGATERVTYMARDMRDLGEGEHYDCVLLAMDTFGYFDDRENASVLDMSAAHLTPGGRIVLEVTSRDFAAKALPGNDVLRWKGHLLVDQSDFDVLTGRAFGERTLVRPDGTKVVARYSLRLYTIQEMVDMLSTSGAVHVDVFDETDATPTLSSKRLTYVALFG